MPENSSKARENQAQAGKREENQLKVLMELSKSFRTMSLYPLDHPQLRARIAENYLKIREVLKKQEEVVFEVSPKGFFYEGEKIGENQQMINSLSVELHIRQIKRFAFRKDMTEQEFFSFLKLLTFPPEDFRTRTLIGDYFKKEQIAGIWVNEIDFGKIFLGRKRDDTLTEEEGEAIAEEDEFQAQEGEPREVEIKIQQLVAELDIIKDKEKLIETLAGLKEKGKEVLSKKNYDAVWYILGAVSEKFSDQTDSKLFAIAKDLMSTLCEKGFLEWIFDRYILPGERAREAYKRFFSKNLEKVADAILDRLSRQDALFYQRELLEYLVDEGEKIREIVESKLGSATPILARKLVYILGEIRSQKSLPALMEVSRNKDLKLKREAFRSLSKIRSKESSLFLVNELKNKKLDLETRTLLIQCLGESKENLAVPALIKILSPWSLNSSFEIKEKAIEALSKIGSKEAIPFLVRVCKVPGFMSKQARLELRMKALEAIGRIGGETAISWLKYYSAKSKGPLKEQCDKLLGDLKRG